MADTYNALGVILNRRARNENDSLVSVYTADYGRLELAARGTQKLNSKLAAHLEPFNLVNLMIIPGRGREYVGSALAENCYPMLKAHVEAVLAAGNAFNLFNRLVKPNQADPNLFVLLADFLNILNQEPDKYLIEPIVFKHWFDLKLLSALGYQPELYHCLACGQALSQGENYFVFSAGGILAADCEKKSDFLKEHQINPDQLIKISDNSLKLLRLIISANFSTLSKVALTTVLIKETNSLIKRIIQQADV